MSKMRVRAVSLPLPATMERPFLLIVGYGVLGSLFMPFLAITLLILLNGKEVAREWRNHALSNVLLGATALIFLVLGLNELRKALGPLLGDG